MNYQNIYKNFLKYEKNKKSLFNNCFFLLVTNCAGPIYPPIYEKAISEREYITSVHKDLISLPPPEKKIPVAVYRFRDQTGQYKPPIGGTNFPTAVTQGATSILIKALEDSGWFIPLERENLSNLLQERKIIWQVANQYKDENLKKAIKNSLQPLIYAPIIFEGGIIGYDTNIVTGGLGAKYFGVGGSGQYRVDRVTVYLRAVSVKNGVILKTFQATKVVLSQELRGGFFRFVRLNRLLEIETGYTVNEPVEMAVQEAIEKAVYDMIIEGVKIGLWKPKDPQAFQKIIEKYEKEKEELHKKLKTLFEASNSSA